MAAAVPVWDIFRMAGGRVTFFVIVIIVFTQKKQFCNEAFTVCVFVSSVIHFNLIGFISCNEALCDAVLCLFLDPHYKVTDKRVKD